MRRLILAVVIFLSVFSLAAQELTKMHIIGMPEKDLTQIVTKQDVNGEFCAGIQVISDMDGFSYDSYNGVVQVDDLPGSDLIYLSPDERVLEVFKTGYKPLKIILSEIGIQLQPKDVWVIEITSEAKTIPVNIVIEPRDAKVLIDGEEVGSGPTFRLSLGKHRLQVSHPQYESVDKEITISEDKTYFSHALKRRLSAVLVIETEPMGAEIFVNNKFFGTTPFQGQLLAGNYQIELRKSLHKNVVERIQVKPALVNKFSFTMERIRSFLKIETAPDANVYLDGQVLGKGSSRYEIAPGYHEVEVRKDRYEPAKRSLTFATNEEHAISLFPKPGTGKLIVFVDPRRASDAEVWLDNRLVGNAPQLINKLPQ